MTFPRSQSLSVKKCLAKGGGLRGNFRIGSASLAVSAGLIASACALGASEPARTPLSATTHDAAQVVRQSTPDSPVRSTAQESQLVHDNYPIAAEYQKNLIDAPASYRELEKTLPPAGKPHVPAFKVQEARFYKLLTNNLELTPQQHDQLKSDGFIAVSSVSTRSMGDAYRDIWEADLPLLVTTDSILHAWHRSYDVTLERLELSEFSESYLALVVKMRAQLTLLKDSIPVELLPEAKKVDVYLSVAASFLEDMSEDGRVIQTGGNWQTDKPAVIPPILATSSEVQEIFDAIYGQSVKRVPYFGQVDFTQFKVRGHYTKGQGLAQYFRAVMWMGRADTGFRIVSPSGEVLPDGVKSAALFSLLANRSDSLSKYIKTQEAIDYFVGRANGLSLPQVAQLIEQEKVTPSDLADSAKVNSLAERFIAAANPNLVTSQAVFTQGHDTPPPLVFQISSQRFVLDSYVHDQTSFDSVAGRKMVDALDVPAALGSATATRLLKSEMEKYPMVRQLGSLQKTISELPQDYWRQNIYTRWLDALRTLSAPPEGPATPKLFLSEVWNRKQLQTQLASWAELRRDTILYAAQTYGTASCDFPDIYVEPYPEFYERMHAMAKNAATRLPDPRFFERFAEIMGNLASISRDQLAGKQRGEEDTRFLKSVVKKHRVNMVCTFVTEWTGWYKELFADADPFKYEPVIADVFTDPDSGQVLNVGTTPVQFAIVALETGSGPTLFLGPISGFRQFAGQRTTDQEWKESIKRNAIPDAPAWTADFQAGSVRTPQPHPGALEEKRGRGETPLKKRRIPRVGEVSPNY